MNLILTQTEAQAMRANLDTTQKYCRQYDFTRRFIARADTQDSISIPMPSEGDFQALGYNIEYDLQADGTESLFLRFSQSDGGKSWSNDLLPIRSIATPGARIAGQAGVRYAFRNFQQYINKNDSLKIEYKNEAAEDLEVLVTFTGFIWLIY